MEAKDKEKRAEDLKTLKSADQLVLSALEAASAAFKALSIEPVDFEVEEASTKFLTDIHTAQKHIRTIISTLSSDLPFENATLNQLIKADLAVQRTAHVHRSLVRTLHNLDGKNGGNGGNERNGGNVRNERNERNAAAEGGATGAGGAEDVLMKNAPSVTEELVDSSGMTPPADLMG